MFTPASSARPGWKCKVGHTWVLTIADKARYGGTCPTCSNDIVLIGFNDLATTHKELLTLWDLKNNSVKPTEVSYGSNLKILWKCPNYNHSWLAPVKEVVAGSRCSICSGHQLLSGFNDLATIAPHLLTEWDDERFNPQEVMPASRTPIKWKCLKGHTWVISPGDRVRRGDGCAKCSKIASRIEEELYNLCAKNQS